MKNKQTYLVPSLWLKALRMVQKKENLAKVAQARSSKTCRKVKQNAI
ncbi:MAG: hypothetical protein K9N09_11040 [Candidatus Cloacimonetes bacterium]|nr:hypothetical protein [Candidatus Cloacimonadota bacterium]